MRALFKRELWKGKGGVGMMFCALQSTKALTTSSKRWFSCREAMVRPPFLPCFRHGGEEFWYSRHIILNSKWTLIKTRGRVTLIWHVIIVRNKTPLIKWALKTWIAFSAIFRLWPCVEGRAGTSCCCFWFFPWTRLITRCLVCAFSE